MTATEILGLLISEGQVVLSGGEYYLPITPRDVLQVALGLIKTKTQTTTLDVKNELRLQGSYVTQDMVSEVLEKAASAGIVEFKDNGKHRIFS